MFLGMRGTREWVPGQRPESWREQILYLYPNGMAPLTAILSMLDSERVDDPRFHWWTQTQSAVMGAIAPGDIFTDAALLVPYAPPPIAAVDTPLYVRITTVLANRIREGHQILLRCAADYNVDVVAKVTGVTRGALLSTVAVKLLEPDDNSLAVPANDLSDADNFKIIGNLNPEGGEMPDAIALNPVEVDNYTQIFRTPLSITRTAKKTRLRTGNQYQKAKAEALEMHSWEMELAFLWGIPTSNLGDNGKPERTTMGVINFIRQWMPANCDDFTTNPIYAGLTWNQGFLGQTAGEVWFKNMLEQIFRYGADEKLALIGSGALLGIDALATAGGVIMLNPGQKTYGMQIREWVTPFGSIYMKTHPLFSADPTTRNMMVILEPKELGYRFIDDTSFYGETEAKTHSSGYGQRRIDGLNEEFLTEAGLEFGLPQKCAVLNGVGLPSALP